MGNQEIKIAYLGRLVHYWPNGADPIASANNADYLPAIVVQSFGGNRLNLQVFTMNQDAPNVLRFSVPHQSGITSQTGYWLWPEVK